jgi:hypothetical protein
MLIPRRLKRRVRMLLLGDLVKNPFVDAKRAEPITTVLTLTAPIYERV